MGRWAFVCLLAVASCVESQSVRCDFGLCPIGTACDEVNDACVLPDQLKVCKGHPDGDLCTIVTDNDGVCKAEICVAPTCGDELVTTGEQCDASVPAEGTCVDQAYDYGVMGCDTTCSPSRDSCHRIGWHYLNVPGVGAIGGIWEDGADVWAASQTGILHYDGTSWSGPSPGTGTQPWWVRGVWAANGNVVAVGSRNQMGLLLRSTDRGATWSEMIVPEIIYAVWGRSANEVYAVGQGGSIYRYTTTWAKISSSGTTDDLRAVYGNAQFVAAVGDHGAAVASGNGLAWQSKRSGIPTEFLLGVWGSSDLDIYAVGYIDDPADPPIKPQVVHLKSGTITTVGSQIPATGTLHAITGRGADQIYIAGDGVVIASDGVGWRPMEVPTAYPLNSIHAGDTRVYAAYQAAFFLELENAAWVAPSPTDPTTSFEDTWTDGTELIAVGDACTFLEYGGTSSLGGTGWNEVSASSATGVCTACEALNAVWGSSSSDVWAAGNYGATYRRVNGTWQCVAPPFDSLKWAWAIWGSGPNDVWLGGSLKDDTEVGLAHFNGSTWTDMSTQVMPHTTSIRGIWGTGANNVYFVGKDGAIVHWNGSTFTKMQSPTTAFLRDVHGFSQDDIYAVGEAGTIVHYDGTTWSLVPVPHSTTVSTTSDLREICGRASDDVFAIGGRTLLHYNGAGWAPVTRPDGDAGTVCETSQVQLLIGGDLGAGSRLVGRLLP